MMEKEPFHMVSSKYPDEIVSKKNKPLPIIKSVRYKFNFKRSIINMPIKDENGNIISKNRFVNNERNYIMVFYRNSSGKKKFAQPISFFESVKRKQKCEKLIPDEIEYKDEIYGLDKSLPWIKIGDIVFLYKKGENIDEINWEDKNLLSKRLFKIKSISSSEVKSNKKVYEYGYIYLLNIKRAKDSGYKSQNNIEKAIKLPSFKLSHDKFDAIKVRLNSLGEIIAKGEECFIKNEYLIDE